MACNKDKDNPAAALNKDPMTCLVNDDIEVIATVLVNDQIPFVASSLTALLLILLQKHIKSHFGLPRGFRS